MTETWLSNNADKNYLTIENVKPIGYNLMHVPRTQGRGGGVGLVYKETLKLSNTTADAKTYKSFEYCECTFRTSKQLIRILVLYKPPSTSKHNSNDKVFTEEFSSLLNGYVISSGKLIICGDMNYHLENVNDRNVKKLLKIWSNQGFQQHAQGATHTAGHTLDFVLTRDTEDVIDEVEVSDVNLSDHYLIKFNIKTWKAQPKTEKVTYRSMKKIIPEHVQLDIDRKLNICETDTIEDMLKKYKQVAEETLNHHAPVKTRMMTRHPNAPWYNEELREQKQLRRKLERRWKTTRETAHKMAYKSQCKKVNRMLDETKTRYYSKKVTEAGNNQKEIFRIINTLLHRGKGSPLPHTESDEQLCEDFAEYFTEKIVKIREDLEEAARLQDSETNAEELETHARLTEFMVVDEEEVRRLIQETASKTCELDALTWLLKECLTSLLPMITKIINMSLSTAHVPSELKRALLKPLIKKALLDPELKKNYRPVSNLDFISKLIEKVASIKSLST